MPEILLHYIWQNRLFDGQQFTTDGRRIAVLQVGHHNRDAGPDFDDAVLVIDGQKWVGRVEIHVHASDWYRHHHEKDAAYDNVILHVVKDADREVFNSKGQRVSQCALAYPMEQDYLAQLLESARQMDSPLSVHECGQKILKDPDLITKGWKKSLLTSRLDCKTDSVKRLLALTQNSLEQAFYITLAHNFGFHTNGLPFEQLALATPLRFLQKHRSSLFQMTAMLLGQSGLLETSESADRDSLYKEYLFLKNKFTLTPIDSSLWKKLRMRPQNFPETRIRQFAALLYQSEFLLSASLEAKTVDALRELFTLRQNDEDTYRHLLPPLPIGTASIDTLIINTVVPYKYARGRQDEALSILEALPSENNTIIRQWKLLGQKVQNAADSQALIHLFMNYCSDSKCMNCEVAYQIFVTKGERFASNR